MKLTDIIKEVIKEEISSRQTIKEDWKGVLVKVDGHNREVPFTANVNPGGNTIWTQLRNRARNPNGRAEAAEIAAALQSAGFDLDQNAAGWRDSGVVSLGDPVDFASREEAREWLTGLGRAGGAVEKKGTSPLPIYKIKADDVQTSKNAVVSKGDTPGNDLSYLIGKDKSKNNKVSASGTPFKKGSAPKTGASDSAEQDFEKWKSDRDTSAARGEEAPGKPSSRLTPAGSGERKFKGASMSSSGGTQGIWGKAPVKAPVKATADTTDMDLSGGSSDIRIDPTLGDKGRLPYMGKSPDLKDKGDKNYGKIKEEEETTDSSKERFKIGKGDKEDDSAASYNIKNDNRKDNFYIKVSSFDNYKQLYPELGRKGQSLIDTKNKIKFSKDGEDYYQIIDTSRFDLGVDSDTQLRTVADPTYSFKDKESQLRANLVGANAEEKKEVLSKWKETDPEKRKNLSAAENALNWEEDKESRDKKQSVLDKGSNRELPEKPKQKHTKDNKDEPAGAVDLKKSEKEAEKAKQGTTDAARERQAAREKAGKTQSDIDKAKTLPKNVSSKKNLPSPDYVSRRQPEETPKFKPPVSKTTGKPLVSTGNKRDFGAVSKIRESKVMSLIKQVIKEELNRK